MLTTELARAAFSSTHPRARATRVVTWVGALAGAMFLVLAWGAFRSAAFGDSTAVPPPAATKAASIRQHASGLLPAAPTTGPGPIQQAPPPPAGPTKVVAPVTRPARATSGMSTPSGPKVPKPALGTATSAVGSQKALKKGPPAAALWATRKAATASNALPTALPPVAPPAALPSTAPPAKAQLHASATLAAVKLTVAAAAPAINQCNGTDNAGGQAVACDVTVTNNLDVPSGLASSVVTVRECHGAANTALTCTTSTARSNQLVTSVTQCDGSGSGGGGTVACTVQVVNNITNIANGSTSAPATINQCVGSGQGGGAQPTVLCAPTGSTTNATITQCNGSGNGGGGMNRVQCAIGPAQQTAALPITIDQCNGSGNGGGATVTCTSSMVTNIIEGPGGVVPPPGPVVVPPPGLVVPAPGPVAVPLPVGPVGVGPPSLPGFVPLPPGFVSGPFLPGISIPGVSPPGFPPRRVTFSSTGTPSLAILLGGPAGTPRASASGTTAELARTGSDLRSIVMLGLLAAALGALLLALSAVRSARSRV